MIDKPVFTVSFLCIRATKVKGIFDVKLSLVRVEFESRESLNEDTPESPILLKESSNVLRLEFDLRESLNAHAPDEPIEFHSRLSSVRVEFDLRESLNRSLDVGANLLNKPSSTTKSPFLN